MPRVHYGFSPEGPIAEIKPHSIAKHKVLHSYLSAYFQTLAPSHQQEELKLTIVDGFAGGGIYEHSISKEPVLGSPFVFLKAAQEADAIINQGRNKPFRMNIDYFFIEKEKDAHTLLKNTLIQEEYGARLETDIKLIHGTFEQQITPISEFIKKKNPRNGRSIFFLDQYGYTDVPTDVVRRILGSFPTAEIILTFNVDSFINFASDSSTTNNILRNTGIPDALRGRSIEDIKNSERDFRLYIQSCLYQELVTKCGARFFTSFFIRTEGHGDYWLVHLSQHHRARDVMTKIHWSHNNHFIHYGGPGLNMYEVLGYDHKYDLSNSNQLGFDFLFDNPAEERSVNLLMNQLPHYIFSHDEGISFGELFATTCNTSPADSIRYKKSVEQLYSHKEIEILSTDGKKRTKATTIRDTDRLIPSKQRSFSFE
ncbi:MAG: three-Cys-motif partner protein TcmP [Candidatus Thiodiazotropha sp. (ex Lucinoma kastoroae)]|nr:three-Cys-motif partner protein TcmP [Candidatus Thiodiazotropha sp. (ex Lucinoma kastoroae)]